MKIELIIIEWNLWVSEKNVKERSMCRFDREECLARARNGWTRMDGQEWIDKNGLTENEGSFLVTFRIRNGIPSFCAAKDGTIATQKSKYCDQESTTDDHY